MKIIISQCGSSPSSSSSWVVRVRTNDPEAALSRAVARLWGRNAFFQPDRSLSGYGVYGQVFRRLPARGALSSATSATGRVRVDMDIE